MATAADFFTAIDAYKTKSKAGVWSSWINAGSTITGQISYEEDSGGSAKTDIIYLRIPSAYTGSITTCTLSIGITETVGNGYIYAHLYDADPTSGSPSSIGDKSSEYIAAGYTGTLYFSFTGLSVNAAKNLYIMLTCSRSGQNPTFQLQIQPRLEIAGEFGNLSIGISPATTGTGQPVTLTFVNRLGNNLSLAFKKSSTTLYTTTATSDSIQVTPTNEWFTTAGETGTSMTVSVSASDSLSRTASGSFSLKQALTVTTTAPKNTTRTASSSMSYLWSVSGSTTQASASLYINGSLNASVTGTNTYASSSYRPPAGTVSWYVEVTNNLGVTSRSDTATFTIQYVSTSYLSPDNSKTSGSIDRFSAQTFSVRMKANGTPYTDYTCTDAVFYWRLSGETAWNSVTMTQNGAAGAKVTIPANTFPKGTIQWYASAGDGQGSTRSTSTYNLSTVAVPITATPTAPIDTVETSNTPTVFTWTNSGTITIYPTLAQLQYSTDSVSWNDMGTVEGTGTSYTEPAGILPGGQIFWRVRVKNTDDVWGEWSAPVSFENFGAPFVDNVTADSCPFSTVTWSSSTQAAYKIVVDGRVYGPYWGANVNSFRIPEPLSDGQHTVSVVVQNSYEQWSEPAETGFTVTNVPGEPVTLTGLFDRDAELSWSTNDATSDFLIYRDDVQIGHASGRSFIDRVVLGYHSWRVINRLPGGYYTASNVVSGTLMTGRLAIAPLSGGAWLELTKSENSARSVVWNESQRVVLRQFAGQIYPQAEAAPYKTMSAGFDVAWTHAEAEQAAVFASLIGQPVIFKTPCEGAMVGILTAWQRNNMHFYRSYSATVQRIHWRDFVDADD